MEEKKSRYSQAQNRATQKYIKEHLESIQIRVPKGRKAFYKSAADSAGQSLNQFTIDALDEKISRNHIKL